MTPQQARDASLGRYWGSADGAALTEHPEGDATVRFSWADGAAFSTTYATHDQARHDLARLGFCPTAPRS